MHKPLAVFDVDGTLVDSRTIITECCQEALVGVGLPEPSYDEVRQIVGLGLKDALAILAPGLAEEDVSELARLYRAAFLERHARPGYIEPLYEGAQETLERLKDAGWRLAMATGKNRSGVERIIAMHRWERMFDTTHCDEDGRGKPHPDMLVAAIAAMDATAGDTIMIGDTSHDMKMALAAGTYAQGVAWGFHTPEEVLASGAHHMAHSFPELDAALDRFAAKEALRG